MANHFCILALGTPWTVWTVFLSSTTRLKPGTSLWPVWHMVIPSLGPESKTNFVFLSVLCLLLWLHLTISKKNRKQFFKIGSRALHWWIWVSEVILVSEESERWPRRRQTKKGCVRQGKALGDFPGMKGRLWWSLRKKKQKNQFDFRKNNPDGDWLSRGGSVWGVCARVQFLSCVWLFVTPRTVAHHAPLSIGISLQKHWSRLPFPPPGDHHNPGIKPASPALQADSLQLSHKGSQIQWVNRLQ